MKKRVEIQGVLAHFADSDIKSATQMIKDTNEPNKLGGIGMHDTVLVELKDGRTFRLVRDGDWKQGHFPYAQRLVNAYVAACGLTVDDLVGVFETSGIAPGYQIIHQSPKGTPYAVALCRTDKGKYIIWYGE